MMWRRARTSLLVTTLLLTTHSAIALKPAEIMDKVNNNDMGDNAASRMIMTITAPNGQKKTSELVSYRKNFEGSEPETRYIMFYTSPATLAGVGFLSIDYKNPKKADERWFYSPAIKQVKRVASSDKRMAFMNSDFSYADMTVRDSRNYIFFNALEEEVIDGQKVWVFEGSPIHEEDVGDDGYAKSIFYVRQDNFILVRTVNIFRKGGKEKQMDISQLEKVDGHWVMGKITMVTRKAGKVLSTTELLTKDTQFNQTFDKTFFTQEQLPLGIK